MTETHRPSPANIRQRPRLGRFLVPLIFVGLAAVLIGREIPQVHEAYERMVVPEQANARQLCQDAALGASTQAAFARVIDTGVVHTTQDGFLVEGIRIGEMGEQGAEVQFAFSCYVDTNGRLINNFRDDRVRVIEDSENRRPDPLQADE